MQRRAGSGRGARRGLRGRRGRRLEQLLRRDCDGKRVCRSVLRRYVLGSARGQSSRKRGAELLPRKLEPCCPHGPLRRESDGREVALWSAGTRMMALTGDAFGPILAASRCSTTNKKPFEPSSSVLLLVCFLWRPAVTVLSAHALYICSLFPSSSHWSVCLSFLLASVAATRRRTSVCFRC